MDQMERVERSKEQEKEELDRPTSCRACDALKDCENCSDILTPYEKEKFGPRCQAVCKLNELSVKRSGLEAERIKSQCRRAACFRVPQLSGYFYCAEHAAVYRNLLNPKVIGLRIDDDLQDAYFGEVIEYYRRLGRDGMLGEKFDFAKKNELPWWYETGGALEVSGKEDEEALQRIYKFVKRMSRQHEKQKNSIVTHVEFTFWETYEVTFIDVQTGYVLSRVDRDSPTFSFPVLLYARAVTYEWLYKYIGPIHDDSDLNVEAMLRNRLLAEALLLDPARLFYSKVEEYDEPTEEQYHDYKKEAKVPWLRYPLTNRAVTLMPSMCSRRLKTDCKGAVLFPVVRYRKLYYNKQELKGDSPFCGKFYFYEPQSSIVLNLGRVLVSASKPHAMWMLLNEAWEKTGGKWHEIAPYLMWTKHAIEAYNTDKAKEDQLKVTDDGADFVKILQAWSKSNSSSSSSRLRHFWKFALPKWPAGSTAEDYETYYFSLLESKQEKNLPMAKHVNATPLWPFDKNELGSKLKWKIGAHDFADQSLCHLAKWLKYDTVLLQHEHGSHRSVTEILDTRQDSYDFLYRTTRDPIHDPWFPSAVHSRFSTVWYRDYAFIQV